MERVSGEKTAEGATPMLTGPRGEEGIWAGSLSKQ